MAEIPIDPPGLYNAVDVSFNPAIITKIYNEFVVYENSETAILFSGGGVTSDIPLRALTYNMYLNHTTPQTTHEPSAMQNEAPADDVPTGAYYGNGSQYIPLTVSAHTHPRNMYRHVSGIAAASGAHIELQDISPPSIHDYNLALYYNSPCHLVFASEGVWCIKSNILNRRNPDRIEMLNNPELRTIMNSITILCDRLNSQNYITNTVRKMPFINEIYGAVGSEPYAINPQHTSVITSNAYLNYRIQLYTYLLNRIFAPHNLFTLTFHYYTTYNPVVNSITLLPPIGNVYVIDPTVLLRRIPRDAFSGAIAQAKAPGALQVYAQAAGVAYSLYTASPDKKIVMIPNPAYVPADATPVPQGTLLYPLDAMSNFYNMTHINVTVNNIVVPANAYLVSAITPETIILAGASIMIANVPPAPVLANDDERMLGGGRRKRCNTRKRNARKRKSSHRTRHHKH